MIEKRNAQHIPGTVSKKDPTECYSCKRREPEIIIVAPRLCNQCRNAKAAERKRKARERKNGEA